MIVIDCEQNSQEWLDAKIGVPSASAFKNVVTTTGKRSSSRDKYKNMLIDEMFFGVKSQGYYSEDMRRGHENEPKSRKQYSFVNSVEVVEVGFCLDDSKMFGCSPDGLVGENGGFETKDAKPHIQIDRLENGWDEHFQQVQGCLLVTGREWWDLQSYCEGLPPLTKRIARDEKFLKALKIELIMLHNDIQRIVDKYQPKGIL